MDTPLDLWQQQLRTHSGLAQRTVTEYVRDAQQFMQWLCDHDGSLPPRAVSKRQAVAYRDALLDHGRAPTTINRVLISLALFLDFVGNTGNNPFRGIDRVEIVPRAPVALSRSDWWCVLHAAEA